MRIIMEITPAKSGVIEHCHGTIVLLKLVKNLRQPKAFNIIYQPINI